MIQREREIEEGRLSKRQVASKWSDAMIKEILDNDFYIGTFRLKKRARNTVHGKDKRVPKEEQCIFENHHPAIIDKSTFALVQELKEKRNRTNYSDSSSVGNTNMLSDYAAIKNGSYGKLMKAYYAKQDAEKLSGKGDTSQKLTLMKTSADSLKKSADALNDSSLWEKKKIKKKDEKTGEEIEVEDYDWDKIPKAVKSFVEDYNDVVKEAGESNTKDVLRNASWMTGMTDKNSNMLAKIGITI